ncbi:hypothetical protein OIU34_19790 [Pararhizobium sp. BT-229]|uniref:hypothetical protein n=1 Tax=Pararhizobium sp. BT-229 TaxID=2986923 RepID=UPI0021F74860|nr:hypothetical protein [Pararhizobium sp. BT-229]MCV9964128.1 hypothetical protein [Pararhizobium sp. BT-229]
MNWDEIEGRLYRTRESDDDLNKMLFAKAFGWSYPLVGAAYHHFHDLTREYGKTDFTGDAEAAFVLARRVLEKARFRIDVREDKSAEVAMSGQDFEEWNPGIYYVVKTAPSLPLAICRCAFQIMKEMSEKSGDKELIG